MSGQEQIRDYFQCALVAAQNAGELIRKNQSRLSEIGYKGRVNLVTEMDVMAEKLIVKTIQDRYPEHRFIAEETRADETPEGFTWFIDPIDGTTNYVHGFRFYCVSIALAYNGQPLIGIVYDPVTDELFSAIEAQGAYLNKYRIAVSDTKTLEKSLLATGFPYEYNDSFRDNMSIFQTLYPKTQGIRRAGAAALDLCYVAAGRFDGFWEFDLNPWDVAAGILIVREAGGRVSNFSGEEYSIFGKQTLASNGKIHDGIMSHIRNILYKRS